ncbi:MAG: UDP-N-acetylmuramoyl-L-alanyl-D-glutamate--2,6-diaminopimelate ligase [Oscillospiraceae bacterium]|nr:UDP-N-acetylmuramoyl-L-alanyl-D-glutamate--2,6-diaminopimelate ligase [Oscillospiraceae bacterium]
MKLEKLLFGIDYSLICGNTDIDISDICYDSRKAENGKIFVALPGTNVDGHDFIPSAYEKGARAFVVERGIDIPAGTTVIKVENCRKALALLSKNYFGDPSSKMTMIGITGTKGKSSITAILKTVLDMAGKSAGTIGTTGVFYADKQFATLNTTPESYETYRYLSDMQKAGCTHVIMEVSSQGLMMHRVFGITFDYGVFTNLSPDHIGKGEHDSFEHYLKCKALLWDQTKKGIANHDDAHFDEITKNAICPITTFAVHKTADVTADNISLFRDGKHLNVKFDCHTKDGDFSVTTNVPGEFTVYNCLTAISVAREIGIDFDIIAKALSDISVKGRMELVGDTKDYSIIIDYAHNAVSLETILKTIRQYEPQRIVCLFGCGGNRPKMRRYEMGEISGKYADFSILTSDNSRFEKPEDIINDILVGMNKTSGRYIAIADRVKAIHYAIDNAQAGDIILVAGKGHEMYQEIEGVKHPFNEAQIICDYLDKKNKSSGGK